MKIRKEIKENKWGIILGGIWGCFSLWIILFSRMDIPQNIWSNIVIFPGWLTIFFLYGSSINIYFGFIIASIIGMIIGFFIDVIVRSLIGTREGKVIK